MKLLVALGFFVGMTLIPPPSQAEDGIPEPKPTPESVLVNQKLAAKVEEVERQALHIKTEIEGTAYLNLHEQSFVEKSQFIFFRRRGTRLQMIAMGTVKGERTNPKDQSRELLVEIAKDSIVKYPQGGDLAVPLADPMTSSLAEKHENSNTPVVRDATSSTKPQPGYLQFMIGLMNGRLTSDGNPQIGGGKNSNPYRFKTMNFEYFSGVSPIGFSYDSHAGNLPTLNYSGVVVNSSESVSHIQFYYRLRPIFGGKLQFIPKAFLLSDNLTTDNHGSELFTTSISAFGAGVRTQFLFASDDWKPKDENRVALQPLNLFVDFGLSPMVTAQDAGPSRGTQSTGSSLMEYRFGGTALFWLKFVPLLKRWVVQGSYGVRKYSLSFQGPTTPEVGNPAPFPSGLSMHESEIDYRFYIGLRLGDPISSLFSSGEDSK